MQILQSVIASVGITANLTVIIVFLSHRKLRLKIPNRFIVNQVSKSFHTRHNVAKRHFGTCLVAYFPCIFLLKSQSSFGITVT